MSRETVIFDAAIGGGNRVEGYIWPSDVPSPKGLIQICHGMTDHMGRYEEMISFLNNEGWHVCGMDMIGHGKTYDLNSGNGMPKGYFGGSKDSAMMILKDIMTMHGKAVEYLCPDGRKIPMILLGHSMGSFIARNIYMTPEYAREFDGFIFSSTMGPAASIGFGIFLARAIGALGMSKKPGKIVDRIAFGAYNKSYDHPKTDYDWLSSDESEVQKYIEDPMAGFDFTYKGFADLFFLIKRMQGKAAYDNASTRPCLFTYGEDDPVTGYGKGVRKVISRLREDPSRDVREKDYGHYRHELCHEYVRGDYFRDISDFCSEVAGKEHE